MKIRKKLSILAALTLVLTYILSPGNYLVQKAYADEEGNSSTIGGIVVDNLSTEDLKAVLNEAIKSWTNEPIILVGGGTNLELDPTTIQYDVDATIATYETLTNKAWYEFWTSKRIVHLPFQVMPSETIKNEIASVAIWDTDQTYELVMTQAAYLRSHEIEATVSDLTSIENERIVLAIEKIPSSAMGINDLTEALNDQLLNPGESYSLLDNLGDRVDMANRDALNFVASMVYSVALQINSEILERSSQKGISPYLEPGIEAAIDRSGNKDLRFVNTMASAIKFKLAVEGENFKVEAYSTMKEQEVTVRVVRDREVAPRIITRYSNKLAIGEQELVQEGTPGLRVSVYRIAADTGVEELVSKDYYAPTNRIVVKSSRQPVTSSTNSDGSSTNATIDLDGDGLEDYEDDSEGESGELNELPLDDEDLPEGSYYDKGGNLITP
ncbi:VanW family protein [Solibacillus sp. FSL H8-0538]|uniref:VanW family protein n=1 Tax=Solibacillus sp. FSL H8-0538 TaxID=2921400 RepID=UPI0030F9E7C7